MANIGRNEPCPCGSGKKYKKCCLVREQHKAQMAREREATSAREFNQLLSEAVGDQKFETMEEMQGFIDQFAAERNAQGLDDFAGLAPNQIEPLIEKPFESPELLTFNPGAVTSAAQAPLLWLSLELLQATGEDGIKPTAKGNLPRKICQELAERYQALYPSDYVGSINKEDDFFQLGLARLLLQMAGLQRKYQGKFVLTKKGKELLASDSVLGDLYLQLLQAYCGEYNWAYASGDEGLIYIRQSFAFSLYLLAQNGSQFSQRDLFVSQYLTAFPAILEDVSEFEDYDAAEDEVRRTYNHWMWHEFAFYFGLIDTQDSDDGEQVLLRGSELFGQVVKFTV